MVNFRFHIISLVAVFLALGSTVIDQATVKGLKNNLASYKHRSEAERKRANELADDLSRWDKFAEQARDQLLPGRLAGVPVLLVAVQGVAHDRVADLHTWLGQTEADDQGTLWLQSKLAASGSNDSQQLAQVLGTTTTRPDVLRREVVGQLSDALVRPAAQSTPPPGPLLAQLRQAGFVDYDSPSGHNLDVGSIPAPGTRLVVISGPGADVPDVQLAVPLCGALARNQDARVVAAEGLNGDPQARTEFVGPLRRDKTMNARVSTVDDLEQFYGTVALVLALDDLGRGDVGHYGVGPGASRLVPAPAQPPNG